MMQRISLFIAVATVCCGISPLNVNAQNRAPQTTNNQTATAAAQIAARQTANQANPRANPRANPQQNAQAPVLAPAAQPFPALSPAEQKRLDAMLQAWETQSKGTKTMACKFQKWHFDLLAAPAGIHATKSSGTIKYAAPDKGMFKEETLLFYLGMKEGKPQYGPQQGKFGDYWVCTGDEVIEFNGDEKKCTLTTLPPGMKGAEIFNSPLPFVFNLDAKKIQQRYWVREIKAPKEGIYLIEAWPKLQADRSQYRMVQIALDDKKFLPSALIMYAPNFHAANAPMWDHYEFEDVSRNAIVAGLQERFFNSFIPEKPPADWQIVREQLPVGAAGPGAAGPGAAGPGAAGPGAAGPNARQAASPSGQPAPR